MLLLPRCCSAGDPSVADPLSRGSVHTRPTIKPHPGGGPSPSLRTWPTSEGRLASFHNLVPVCPAPLSLVRRSTSALPPLLWRESIVHVLAGSVRPHYSPISILTRTRALSRAL